MTASSGSVSSAVFCFAWADFRFLTRSSQALLSFFSPIFSCIHALSCIFQETEIFLWSLARRAPNLTCFFKTIKIYPVCCESPTVTFFLSICRDFFFLQPPLIFVCAYLRKQAAPFACQAEAGGASLDVLAVQHNQRVIQATSSPAAKRNTVSVCS